MHQRGFSSMTSRVVRGRPVTRLSRAGATALPAVWPSLNLQDASVFLTLCKPAVRGDSVHDPPDACVGHGESLPLNLFSRKEDRDCAAARCNSVAEQSKEHVSRTESHGGR
jgi:hypothetical protein